jgi:hypothetical protein
MKTLEAQIAFIKQSRESATEKAAIVHKVLGELKKVRKTLRKKHYYKNTFIPGI